MNFGKYKAIMLNDMIMYNATDLDSPRKKSKVTIVCGKHNKYIKHSTNDPELRLTEKQAKGLVMDIITSKDTKIIAEDILEEICSSALFKIVELVWKHSVLRYDVDQRFHCEIIDKKQLHIKLIDKISDMSQESILTV